MMGLAKKGVVHWAAAAAALLGMAWTPTARAHDDGDDRALRAAIEHAERSAQPGRRPIVETHILEYHGEKRGDLYVTKDMLLAVGDRYEKEIAAAKAADAPYR